ncbi:MAG: DNA polymerase III subunit beta [Acholeplasmataceae bacterium]
MNFTIKKNVLLNYLLHIQRGLPVKTPLPILYALKLEVFSDYIEITSSNSDIAIQTIIEDESLTISKTGRVAIPGRYFIDIIRKIDANLVQISLREERLLVITADRSEFKLKLMNIDDYPGIDFIDTNTPITLSSDVLKEIIRETSFATADSEKRPILTGVNFKYQDEVLYTVATDSFRLSQKHLKIDVNSDEFNLIIPGKSLEELTKILDHNEEPIDLYISPNKILFKFNNILFQTRLLEGTYPDTLKIIPQTFPSIIKFNKEELLATIDRVSLLSPKDRESNYNIIKLTLRSDQVVEISSTNTDVGDAKEEVLPTADPIGELITIAFSSKYLNEALKAFKSSEVTLNFGGEIRPFVIKGDNDPNLLHLILPVRID